MLRLIIAILCCSLTAGCCGFKLRGTIQIPDYLRTIYICPNDPYEPFQRAVRARLARYKVHIVCEPSRDVPTLELGRPNMSEESLAWGPDAQIQRFKYIFTVDYKYISKDVKYTQTIVRTREISRDNNQLLSNESEKQIVQRELLEEAANELIKRLSSGPPHTVPSLETAVDNNPC